MNTKMNFEEFVNYIIEHLTEYIPEHKKESDIGMYTENSMKTLVIKKKGSDIGASANMDGLYGGYLDGSFSLEEILADLGDAICKAPETFHSKCLSDPEFVKPRLFIRVCSLEKNKDFLENVPYEKIEDLAITCHVMVDKKEGSLLSMAVNNGLMQLLGFTKERLFEMAKENSGNILPARLLMMAMDDDAEDSGPAGIIDVEEFFSMVGTELYGDALLMVAGNVFGTGKPPMFVVTNGETTKGASAIFYPGMMERVAKVLGGSYFIVPSSIHETIVTPERLSNRLDLLDMVKDMNKNVTDPEDTLTDNVYFYDAQKKRFSVAE